MKTKTEKTAEKVVRLLARKNKPVNVSALSILAGINNKEDYRMLNNIVRELCNKNVIKRVGRGYYEIRSEEFKRRLLQKEKMATQKMVTESQKPSQDVNNAERWIRVAEGLKRLYNFDVDNLHKEEQKDLFDDVISKMKLGWSASETIGLIAGAQKLAPRLDLPQVAPPIKNDAVNSPAHYTDGKIEVIDFIEDKALNFHLGNAVKYISRAGKKDPAKLVEDLEKAQWYLNRVINNLKNK